MNEARLKGLTVGAIIGDRFCKVPRSGDILKWIEQNHVNTLDTDPDQERHLNNRVLISHIALADGMSLSL